MTGTRPAQRGAHRRARGAANQLVLIGVRTSSRGAHRASRIEESLRVVPEKAGPREWASLAVLTLAVLVLAVDGTVLSLAIPALSQDLAPSATGLLWIGDSYSFVLAGLLISMGSLADRIGRKRLLLMGIVGFAAASTLAAYAPSVGWLIAARALQGVTGATLMPATLSIIRASFADKEQRTMAIGIWSAATAAGGAAGPLIGGFMLTHFWWGSVFLVNLPVMLLLLALAIPLLPESRDPNPGPFDLVSAGLSLAGMIGVVYMIKELAAGDHKLRAVGVGLVGAVLLAAFVRRQRRLAHPMIDVSLFARPAFTGSVLSSLLVVFAMSGLLFFMSQFFQLVQGLSALETGVRILPVMFGGAISAVSAPGLLRVMSRAACASIGLVAAAAGFGVVAFVITDGNYPTIGLGMFVIGIGVGLVLTISSDTVLSSVPPAKAGAASAVSETSFELGTALGIAVLGSVLAAVYRSELALPAALPAEAVEAARDSLAGALGVAAASGQGALAESARIAFVDGIQASSIGGALLSIMAAVAAGALLPRHRDDPDAPPQGHP